MDWPQILTTITEGNAISTVVDAPWVSVTSVNGMTGDVVVEPVVKEFQANHYYPKDTVITHNGELYSARANFTSGNSFNVANWKLLSDDQDFAVQEGSTQPVFENMVPIQSFEWDISDTTYRALYQMNNTGWTQTNMEVVVAYRITVTGSGIDQVCDVIDRWLSPTTRPVTSILAKTLSQSASTTGFRYLRSVFPTNSYVNNVNYPIGQEIQPYNATARHIKVDVYKTDTGVVWNTTKPSASIYKGSSTYQATSAIEVYASRGWVFRGCSNVAVNSADTSGCITDYERAMVGSSVVLAGEALTAGYFAYLADDGKVYMMNNTTKNISVGESKIGWISNGVNSGAAISNSYWRTISRPNSTQYGYFSHDTMALGDRVYLRCTRDSNGKIHSDNYLASGMSAGYTWMPLGIMTASNTFYADTRNPMFYTINSSGKLTHINGEEIVDSTYTVNNATLTIQKNGTTVQTFTANASSNKTANITMDKTDVGLGNVDNTSDANKPISTATQTALNNKLSLTGGTMTGAAYGFYPATASTMVGNEYNILLNGGNRYTFTQSGTGTLTDGQVKALFDGKLAPQYSSDGVNPNNPYVLLIEGLPDIHTQTGGVFGWTCRYYVPTTFKVELYDNYNSRGWVTIVEKTNTATKELFVNLYSKTGGGSFTKARITIYDSNGAVGANGYRRWGISEIFFCHPEAISAYEYASVDKANSATKATQDASGNVITTTYATKSEIPTVNNATLTITQNGTTKGTFTANASSNKTIDVVDTTYTGGTNIDITSNVVKTKTLGIEYIVGTQSSSTNAWTGTSTDTGCSNSTVYTGKVIVYHLPYAGTNSNATLNLTLPDGTTTGAKNIRRFASSGVTTNYGADYDIFMIYDGTQWKVSAYQDSDSYYLLRFYNTVLAAAAITSGRICVGGASGYQMAASGVTSDITYPILYAGSNVASGATNDNFYAAQRSINLQNTKSGWTGTTNRMVFLVGTLSGTTFTVGSDVFTQTIPTSADGKVYAPIGYTYSTTNIYFYPSNNYWEYRNGAFRPISTCPTLATVATSGSYNDLSNKPTIPTVNNATLTIQKNGSTVKTFTANASSNVTANITVPTKTSDITNDGSDSTSTYVEADELATVATSGSYNDLTNKPTIPTVNNATLTIQKNGSTVKTFTANASSNVTANIVVPTKTSDITNDNNFISDSNAQIMASGQGNVAPCFDGMTPVKTFTWSVSDTTYRPVYQMDNTGWAYDNMDIEVAYRITVTGTGINQICDINERWFNPTAWPITSLVNRTLSNSAATTGFRYLRAVYPTSSGLNNNTYKIGSEIANCNLTARTIQVDVFKTHSSVTWNETKPSGPIYTSSTYQATNAVSTYSTRGWVFRAPSSFNANTADAATRVSSYESVTINSSAIKSGEALVAGYLAYQAEDGLIYGIGNNTPNVVANENCRIGLITTDYNANTAIDTRYFRSVTNLSSTQVGYVSHDTLALGNRVFWRFLMDANGKIHSDNYLSTSMSSGYTWLPIGVATASNTIYLDTRKPVFYTIDSNGKISHINGIVLAGSGGGGGGGSYTAGNHISIVNDVISAVDYVHSDTLTAATTPTGTVTTAMIANGAITRDKLASDAKFTLTMSTTDISEGSALATNTLYGVYNA